MPPFVGAFFLRLKVIELYGEDNPAVLDSE
jgi:hypothetical protein